MTRVRSFEVLTHCNDLGGKVWNPAILWTKKYAVFVVLTDDEGWQGLGECWCFDTAPDTLVAYLRTEIAPHVVGLALSDVEALGRRLLSRATLTARHGLLASAISGVDIAIHDLRSKASGVPIWKLLNPSATGTTGLYASGGLYGQNKDNAALATEFKAIAAQEFALVKMKVGALSIADDLKRVNAVLTVLPRHAKLIIDGVYSYSPDDARHLFDALPADRIEAFQSPVAAADIAGMARLVKAGVPVMATEAEYRVEVHERLIGENAVTFLQTAPIACGGFTRLRELSAAVRGSPIRLSLEISSTAVALIAACHFATADETVAHVEYHCLHQVFFEALPLREQPGFPMNFVMPERPGLGIALPRGEVQHAFTLNATDTGS